EESNTPENPENPENQEENQKNQEKKQKEEDKKKEEDKNKEENEKNKEPYGEVELNDLTTPKSNPPEMNIIEKSIRNFLNFFGLDVKTYDQIKEDYQEYEKVYRQIAEEMMQKAPYAHSIRKNMESRGQNINKGNNKAPETQINGVNMDNVKGNIKGLSNNLS